MKVWIYVEFSLTLETPHLENGPLFRMCLASAWIWAVHLDHGAWLVKVIIFKVHYSS